ncbi:MAG TPA: type IV pilus modification protein PilV [Povalibacter sp.]|uniref:type IV pilus modification protein PilV n=1 Tax=Povalibacter sp. TaxID=1962978 RepID=UPI002C6E625C|nr:type IV pilus modification protein PilV [Povalibacter sp.]HMN44085.1 type IV pilus modification protein PilV [Povalibacter sp.]
MQLRLTAHRPPLRFSGFTLVEVIAALLVVGIGLIGIAALYGEAMQTEIDTHPQAQAARLAQLMAEKVNANAAGRTGYANVIGVLCTETRDPRPVNAAAQEAACWHDEIRKALPNGSGAITRDLTTNPPTFVVSVSWSAAGAGAASYVVRVQPSK